MGRRQQSIPPGGRQGDRRSGRGRRHHGEAGRGPEASSRIGGRFAEHADLPDLDDEPGGAKRRRRPEAKQRTAPEISAKDARKAAAEFEREQ